MDSRKYNEKDITASLDGIAASIRDGGLTPSVIADVYDNTKTYAVGDYVVYAGKSYRCITAVETAEDFDSEKWDQIKVLDELSSAVELPPVTSSDNGKILGVEEGAWTKKDPNKEIYIFNINAWDESTYEVTNTNFDRTKFLDAIDNGGTAYAIITFNTNKLFPGGNKLVKPIIAYSGIVAGSGSNITKYIFTGIFIPQDATAKITTKPVYEIQIVVANSASSNMYMYSRQISNELPEVSGSDNGKVLGVSEGAWATIDPASFSDEIVYFVQDATSDSVFYKNTIPSLTGATQIINYSDVSDLFDITNGKVKDGVKIYFVFKAEGSLPSNYYAADPVLLHVNSTSSSSIVAYGGATYVKKSGSDTGMYYIKASVNFKTAVVQASVNRYTITATEIV